MNDAKPSIIRSQSNTETSAQGLQKFGRYHSLADGSEKEVVLNSMCQISDKAQSVSSGSDDVQKSSSMDKPLTDSSVSNLDRENQLGGIKKAIAKVTSIAGNRQSLKVKSALPGPNDFEGSWQRVEDYLGQRTQDTDPETLCRRKKPFYQRTWFACSIYASLLALMVAAILALACNRSVIMPRAMLDGEIIQRATVTSQQPDNPVALGLQQEQTLDSANPNKDAVFNKDSTLLNLISTDGTAKPDDPAESKDLSGAKVSSVVPSRPGLRFILSLHGPLQRFPTGEGSR